MMVCRGYPARAQDDTNSSMREEASPGGGDTADIRVFRAPEGTRVKERGRLGPGMELVSVDGVKIAVPRGARVYKEGSQVLFEDTGEYMARRFDEIQKQIDHLTREVSFLKQELEDRKESNVTVHIE